MSNPKDRVFTIEELVALFKFPEFTINEEWQDRLHYDCYKEYIKQGESKEDSEALAEKYVDKEITEAYNKWVTAVESNVEFLAHKHDLTLFNNDGKYTFEPQKTWKDV